MISKSKRAQKEDRIGYLVWKINEHHKAGLRCLREGKCCMCLHKRCEDCLKTIAEGQEDSICPKCSCQCDCSLYKCLGCDEKKNELCVVATQLACENL